jgi:hypothetical protein
MFRRRILSRRRALRALQKKLGLQTARDVAYFDFIPAERYTLNDFNGKSVSLSDYINKKNVMVVFNRQEHR